MYTQNDFTNILFDNGQFPVTKTFPQKEGLFFTPNPILAGHSHKDDSVEAYQCFFLEWDDKSLEEQFNLIDELFTQQGLAPSAIVFSGNKSLHAFWRIEEGFDLQTWKAVQRFLIEYSGADPSIKNPARLMRMGGYGKQTIEFLGSRIDKSAFTSWLNEMGFDENSSKPTGNVEKAPVFFTTITDDHKAFASNYIKKLARELESIQEGSRNHELFWRVCRAAEYCEVGAYDANTVTAMFRLAAKKCGLEEFEATQTIISAFDRIKGSNPTPYFPDFDKPEHFAFVDTFLKKHKITANKLLQTQRLCLKLQYESVVAKFPAYKREEMFDIYLRNLAEYELEQLVLSVGYCDSSKSPMLASLITDKNVNEVQAVLLHFIWQVKRKALGLPVKWHMMPVLVGGQGVGKSTMLKHLISPIPTMLVGEIDIDALNDDRAIPGLSKKLILFCDEMAGARKAQISNLKKWITSERNSYRPMRTNDLREEDNYSTMIGASNQALEDLIKDDSGMRRFYEIAGKNEFDWAAIDSFDYQQLWNSVNPHTESPIEPFISSILDKQITNMVDSISAWINEVGGSNQCTTVEGWPSSELHKEYVDWCRRNGYKEPKSNKGFSSSLVDKHGWTKKRTSQCVVLVPPSADMASDAPTDLAALKMKAAQLLASEPDDELSMFA